MCIVCVCACVGMGLINVHITATAGECQLEGSIELVGDPSPFDGRVVYCHSDRKRDLCVYGEWDDPSAAVVCRQLGLPTEGVCTSVPNLIKILNKCFEYEELVYIYCHSGNINLYKTILYILLRHGRRSQISS